MRPLRYHVEVATDNDFDNTVLSLTFFTTSGTADANLVPETAYHVRVAAENVFGVGAWSTPVEATTTSAVAGAVAIVEITARPHSVDVVWMVADPVDSYTAIISTNASFPSQSLLSYTIDGKAAGCWVTSL